MSITEVDRTGHLTLHYSIRGNANNPKHADYRSENPWQQLNAIRDELRDRYSLLVSRVQAVLFSDPDDSVWRLELIGDVSPASLERVAKQLLIEIESRLSLIRTDDIRVIVAYNTGVMREWKLTG